MLACGFVRPSLEAIAQHQKSKFDRRPVAEIANKLEVSNAFFGVGIEHMPRYS